MIAQTKCTSFLVECLKAVHDFTASTGDVFYMALYSASATLNADTTAYTATGEVSGTGYTAGGVALTNVTPTALDGVACASFVSPSWSDASFTARGALIYNSSKANRAVCVLDFVADKTATPSTPFVVTMPAVTADTAIIRFL